MVTKQEVKQELHALTQISNEVVEMIPPAEIGLFYQFVNELAVTVAAIHWRLSSGQSANPRHVPGVVDADWAVPLTDLLTLRMRMAHLSSTVEQLWSGADASSNDPRMPDDEAQQYFPVRRSPRRAVNNAELQEANRQWEAALGRGRSHRGQAIEQIGPVLTPIETARRLGVSPVTVKNWRQQNKLLGIRFDDHQYLYPLFQFADSPAQGESGVLRHFAETLRALPFQSTWAKAQFFVSPLPALNGRAPIEIIREASADQRWQVKRPTEEDPRIRQLVQVAEHAGELGS